MGKYTTKSVYKKKKTLNLFNFLRKMRGKVEGKTGENRGGRQEGKDVGGRRGEERRGEEREVVGNDLKSG